MSQATPENSEAAAASADPAPASPATSIMTAHAAQKSTVHVLQTAPASVQAATAATPQAIFDVDPRWRPGLLVGIIVGGIVLLIALILVVAYFLLFLGPGLSFLGGLLALVPLAIVLLGVRWIDRWEPEPRLLLLIAFLWGATVSIVIALVVDVGASYLYAASGTTVNGTVFLQTAVQAPVIEEVGKGLGILLIYLVARRYFDGPVDGIVFAALVGGGFAFTENIQYFAIQIAESGRLDLAVGEIFFIRGILSPFAHVMFSAFIGFFIGLAARKGTALGGGVCPATIDDTPMNTATPQRVRRGQPRMKTPLPRTATCNAKPSRTGEQVAKERHANGSPEYGQWTLVSHGWTLLLRGADRAGESAWAAAA